MKNCLRASLDTIKNVIDLYVDKNIMCMITKQLLLALAHPTGYTTKRSEITL